MAPRPSWNGYLKISLVSVPVSAYVGSQTGPAIRFHQLHKECHSRIRYVKTCPIHGEVSQAEIVLGYESAKDQYVVVEPDELEELRDTSDRAIAVDSFVRPEAVDPAFFTGRTYYLVPDGEIGQKPYELIHDAMLAEGLHAIARMVLTKKEHIVRVRPLKGLLAADVLEYATRVKDPAEFADEISKTNPSAQERKLTRQLIASMVEEKLDLAAYTDSFTKQVSELIEAKMEGKETVVATPAEEPPIVNLMDALRKSMKQGRTPKGKRTKARQPAVRSVARRVPAARRGTDRRRKSG
jgi:DNA end-binding protein Ku